MKPTDPYIFDDEQTTREQPQQITESFLNEEFGSLLDFDDLATGHPTMSIKEEEN